MHKGYYTFYGKCRLFKLTSIVLVHSGEIRRQPPALPSLRHCGDHVGAERSALKYLHENTQYACYQQVIIETTGFDLETTSAENTDFFPLDLHPDGSQVFASVKRFDKEFDRNVFYQLIISLVLKKQI